MGAGDRIGVGVAVEPALHDDAERLGPQVLADLALPVLTAPLQQLAMPVDAQQSPPALPARFTAVRVGAALATAAIRDAGALATAVYTAFPARAATAWKTAVRVGAALATAAVGLARIAATILTRGTAFAAAARVAAHRVGSALAAAAVGLTLHAAAALAGLAEATTPALETAQRVRPALQTATVGLARIAATALARLAARAVSAREAAQRIGPALAVFALRLAAAAATVFAPRSGWAVATREAALRIGSALAILAPGCARFDLFRSDVGTSIRPDHGIVGPDVGIHPHIVFDRLPAAVAPPAAVRQAGLSADAGDVARALACGPGRTDLVVDGAWRGVARTPDDERAQERGEDKTGVSSKLNVRRGRHWATPCVNLAK